jgi:hypothetical protein
VRWIAIAALITTIAIASWSIAVDGMRSADYGLFAIAIVQIIPAARPTRGSWFVTGFATAIVFGLACLLLWAGWAIRYFDLQMREGEPAPVDHTKDLLAASAASIGFGLALAMAIKAQAIGRNRG